METHFIDPRGKVARPKADDVYDFENKATNLDSKGRINSMNQVYKVQHEATIKYKEGLLGIHSKDEMINFCAAAEAIRDEDAKWRDGQPAPNWLLDDGTPDHRTLGILRRFRIDYETNYTKHYTPLQVVFFTMYQVLAYHFCAAHGRVCLNIDGTGTIVKNKFGAKLEPNVVMQQWELWLISTFILASKTDENNVVKRHIKPLKLWQFHSTQTSAVDLESALSLFFGEQPALGLTKHRPLAILSDCATQILTAVMRALAFDDGPEITRVIYNNVMTILISYCERRGWGADICQDTLNLALRLMPTLIKWCRAHILRAVHHYMESTSRSLNVRTNKAPFHTLVKTLLRHSTSTLPFVHSIIHFGLVMYILKTDFLPISQKDSVTPIDAAPGERMKQVEANVQSFITSQYVRLTTTLAHHYGQLVDGGLNTVDRRMTVSGQLINSVVEAAESMNLVFAAPYCYGDGDVTGIKTMICIGFYGRLVDEENDEEWTVLSKKASPKWIYGLLSSMAHSDRSQDEFLVCTNPLHDPSVARYLLQTWGVNLPLIHFGILDMCWIGRQAIVESNNQGIEGIFKDMKNNAPLALASKNVGTYMYHEYRKIRSAAAKLVDQIRTSPHVVEDRNAKLDQGNLDLLVIIK